jgi:hypothetical protein
MRSQIQRGREHLGSGDVVASDPERGVTAVELEQIAMLGALADYRSRRGTDRIRRSAENEPRVTAAFSAQSRQIRSSIKRSVLERLTQSVYPAIGNRARGLLTVGH